MTRKQEKYLINLGLEVLLARVIQPVKKSKSKSKKKSKGWSKAQRKKFAETMKNKWDTKRKK